MEIRSTEEARENVENFSKRFLNLSQQKKTIDEDIKALKDEFKQEGVPVAIVCKAINSIKSKKKKTSNQLFEEETIQEWLESNTDIDSNIKDLVA